MHAVAWYENMLSCQLSTQVSRGCPPKKKVCTINTTQNVLPLSWPWSFWPAPPGSENTASSWLACIRALQWITQIHVSLKKVSCLPAKTQPVCSTDTLTKDVKSHMVISKISLVKHHNLYCEITPVHWNTANVCFHNTSMSCKSLNTWWKLHMVHFRRTKHQCDDNSLLKVRDVVSSASAGITKHMKLMTSNDLWWDMRVQQEAFQEVRSETQVISDWSRIEQ